MKAVVFYEYGTPQVLKLQTVEKPFPGSNEVLVKILATAVNSGDVRLRKADPFAVRFMLGFTKPRINILGGVFSGIVETVGAGVTHFKVGDEVFGSTDLKFGAYAEFKCFTETGTIALKPKNVTHQEAAVLPFGSTTALYFLKKANIQPGQQVLIYGASGAVGSAAIQVAKYFGAIVTGVCSSTNVDFVKGLGADAVIDYTKVDYLNLPQNYDVIYDTVNKAPVAKSFRKLKKKGVLILGAAMAGAMVTGWFLSLFKQKRVIFGMVSQTKADIEFLGNLVECGKLKPSIDRTYALNEIAEAHAYVEQGHKRGNVAIMV